MAVSDIQDISRQLPHQYPFLLIDRILEHERGVSIVALKNVTFNEPQFQGHFPGRPIMPGVLIIEAMAQASSILGLGVLDEEPDKDSLFYLVGVDNTRFKRPVVPGDQLIIRADLVRTVRGVTRFEVKATVDGDLVARSDIIAALRKPEV